MASRKELIDERADLIEQRVAINARILAILGRNNKKYEYSNQESRHVAETHTLTELREMKKFLSEEITAIDNKLCGNVFVQLKNI